MRIPYELLTELANSLLNDTVFEIVKGLMDIQHVTEKHLLQLREQVEVEHQSMWRQFIYYIKLRLIPNCFCRGDRRLDEQDL